MQQDNTGVYENRKFHELKIALSWISWPFLFAFCVALTAYGMSIDRPYLFFNASYLFLIISLLYLERFMPHEKKWREKDGQILADIGHTLTSKGTTQAILYVNTLIGVNMVTNDQALIAGLAIWPSDWPLYAQVALAVVASEFMLYWAHRTAHEVPFIWRFHAVHHSVSKLWIVNTGRFHFIDSLYSIVLGIFPLILLGAPMIVVTWVGAITAFIGMLTHCNVEMRFGWLSYIFNTPGLHRWHHSKKLREGNTNYGENIMLWDLLFGTFFNEDRRPPTNIGITDHMPRRFIHQIIWPFIGQDKKRSIEETEKAAL